MNTRIISIAAAMTLCGCAAAQPQPPEAGGPPGQVAPGEPRPEGRPDRVRERDRGAWREDGQRPMIATAFFGIEAGPVDPDTRTQLKLPADEGLTVNFVADDSPASKAGIKQRDVITKVDNQIVFNPHQLQSLIRSHKPGDEVGVTYYRDGTAKTATVKLAEHTAPAGGFGPGPGGMGMGMGMGGMGMGPMGGGGMGMGPMGMGGPGMRPQGAFRSMTLSDDVMRIEVKNTEGKVVLSATGKDGVSIYNGSIDTPEDRAQLPEPVKQRLNELAVGQFIKTMKNPLPPRMDGQGFGGGPRDGQGGGRGPRDGQGPRRMGPPEGQGGPGPEGQRGPGAPPDQQGPPREGPPRGGPGGAF